FGRPPRGARRISSRSASFLDAGYRRVPRGGAAQRWRSVMSRSLFLAAARLVVWVPSLLLADPRPALCGGVSFLGAQIDDTSGVDGLDGAQFVAVSPDGQNAYVTGRQDDAVAVFD